MSMTRLSEEQIKNKANFIQNYLYANNAATGSIFDANANVSNKNIATLSSEIHKDINIQINRKLVYDRIVDMFGKKIADTYINQIENHEIYVHDESSLNPYCASISMYPFLLNGMKDLGGESGPPKHLDSFCGSFINLIFAVASQFAGAVATVEFLLYFDHFARKTLGNKYLETHEKIISDKFQQVVYSINQPAAARGFQSVFWNISIYDREYLSGMFENFMFPDGSYPDFDSVMELQKFFMKWFNKERESAVLTFPVVTAAMITKDGKFEDEDFYDFVAKELSESNSFFVYMSDTPDSLASCCRLKNNIEDSINDFSYSLGAGGVATGSTNVITLNFNRFIQKSKISLEEQVDLIHKYQMAHRKIMEEFQSFGMLPVYDAGYITLDKQFLTIGLNGVVEAAEYLGYEISNNSEYIQWVSKNLQIISQKNKEASKNYGYKFNTEMVPAENLGVKNANWDKKDGLELVRECYNSYFYTVEDDVNILDKFYMHGGEIAKSLDGGSAYHCNLEGYPTKETFKKLLSVASKAGCDYFCFNIKITCCEECGFIDKRTLYKCTSCDSRNVSHATRVIGYLKKVKDFSNDRQEEEKLRYYNKEIV